MQENAEFGKENWERCNSQEFVSFIN